MARKRKKKNRGDRRRPEKEAASASAQTEVSPPQAENLAETYPTIALVGRPNVGKSSLFNALLKQQISITDARAGTTRDRVLHPLTLQGRSCELLDTGGIGIVDKQNLSDLVEVQIDAAITTATVFALVVDAIDGLVPQDRQIARRLRTLGQPVLLVVNKTESSNAQRNVAEFTALGFDDMVVTSAIHRLGISDLEDALASHLPKGAPKKPEWEDLPKIAVVGRRNVGKSSFVNALAKQDRTIVSEVAGTTRDAVDLLLEKDGQRFCLIDTAGVRRMKEPEGPVEFFAQVRTERAIKRADVILLMLETIEGVSTTDQKTAALIEETAKPCIIVVNKWDEAEEVSTEEYTNYIEKRLIGLRQAPVCYTSAKFGRRCWQTLDVALDLYKIARTEVPTPKLNKTLEEAERRHEPPVVKTRKPRLLYGVQVSSGPPTFVVYCRYPDYIDDKYKRFLSRYLREHLGLEEIPIRIFLRQAPRDKKKK